MQPRQFILNTSKFWRLEVHFSRLLLWMLFSLFNLCGTTTFGQSVTISGPNSVEVGVPASFNAAVSGLPTGSSIISYTWTVTELGPTGTIDGMVTFTKTNNTTNTTNSIIAKWDETYAPDNPEVTIEVEFKDNLNNIIKIRSTRTTNLKGICNFIITGPVSIQKCCNNVIEYCASGYCDGNIFNWSYPTTWTLIGSADGPCIKLIPDANTGGQVRCTIRRAESITNYSKTNVLNITRTNPTITIVGNNQNMCPGQFYNFNLQGSLCNATISWVVPIGWQIVTGEGTPSISIIAGAGAVPGELQASTTYSGGCSAALAKLPLNLLTNAPTTPYFTPHPDDGYTYFHCGRWYVCSGGMLSAYFYKGTQTIEWQISAPWTFIINGQPTQNYVQQVNLVQDEIIHSPKVWLFSNNNVAGIISVRASNCIGSGQVVQQGFIRELNYFCQGGGTSCYPPECACCLPQDVPDCFGTRSTTSELEEPSFQVFPNPSAGTFNVDFNMPFSGNLSLFDAEGRLVWMKTLELVSSFNLNSAISDGLYLLKAENESLLLQKKIIIQR